MIQRIVAVGDRRFVRGPRGAAVATSLRAIDSLGREVEIGAVFEGNTSEAIMLSPTNLFHLLILGIVMAMMARDPALIAAEETTESVKATAAVRLMHDEVARLMVTVERKPKPLAADLKAEPILRYTDPQREFPDATLWVWTVDGRPAAFSKLERIGKAESPHWQYCLATVNDERIDVKWPDGIVWKSRRAGLEFHKLDEKSPPQKTAPLRLAQLRTLARTFRATTTERDDKPEEMRLLTQPIMRYSNPDQKLTDGAVFVLASNGTNPDALLLIQVRQPVNETNPVWEYGCLGLTGDAVNVELEGQAVFKHLGARGPGDHGHWLWVVISSQ